MKNFKIRTKLFILVVLMMAGTITIGITSLLFMSSINDNTTEIAASWLPSTILAEEMNTAVSDVRTQEFKHVVSQDAQEMAQVDASLDKLSENFNSMQQQYSELAVNETDRLFLSDIKKFWDSYLAEGETMLSLSADNKTDEAMAVMTGDHLESFNNLTAKCLELVQFNKTGSDTANHKADIAYATAQKLTIGLLTGLTVVTVLFAVYIVRGITKPVSEIDNVARKIADGQLNESIHYQSKDELGILAVNFNKTVARLRDYVNYIDEISAVLNEVANGNLLFQLTYDYAGEFAKVKLALEHISDSLNNTLTQINQSSEQVASGSDQVASGSQALSQGATEQASSIEELAATINDISQQVSQNAESAQNASKQATIVGDQITDSNNSMKQMTAAMNEISEKSSQIGKIIKTIEDIAFQTNILALNAAVEAARAGEAGKGFAVVADEVRNLASKSAEASKDTAHLIEGSIQAVEKGTQIANSTAEQLIQVVSGAQLIVTTIDGIAAASKRQADSINQVTNGVDQITSVIQTNSATAEESAAASEELSGQAQMLKTLVGKFRLKGNTSESAAEAGYQSFTATALETGSKTGIDNRSIHDAKY